ncbi:MAG: tRNA pseudouridine(55) synthase TruB, partial [Alphaproteobacteria bacterium]|nr:tRNA pseudouridine(55) synthase TruB [Alphaproteobacteria bacterium]
AEGEVIETSTARPAAADIETALAAFIGPISQVPPAFSAIKVKGERAYKLARQGESPELSAREVEVYSFRLLQARADEADFDVACSKGTYIRALARDLAKALGTAGHLVKLRRTQVGPFSEEAAFSLEELEDLGHSAPPETVLMSIETPLDDIPAVAIMDNEASRLRHGQAITVPHRIEGEVLITTPARIVGLGFVENGTLRPNRVFNL